MDLDMQHGLGHAGWTWIMNMHNGHGHALVPVCRNANIKFSPELLVLH
jgi:hypothetical protein